MDGVEAFLTSFIPHAYGKVSQKYKFNQSVVLYPQKYLSSNIFNLKIKHENSSKPLRFTAKKMYYSFNKSNINLKSKFLLIISSKIKLRFRK